VVDYTIKNPVHTYQTAGTFTVKLTVTNASGSDSEVKTGYISTTSSPVVAGTGDFGAESNPTGNPIGGGAGYTRIISETDSRVKYVVSTATELITALRSAKSGDVVFIKGTAVIDMTANPAITIPAGVTLASDRGLNGSLGALIKRTKNVNGGWGEQIFIAGGNNVRLTGVRLEGEMYPQDYGNKAGETYEQQYLVGIYAKERTGYEVDNCELRGFAWSAVVSDNCVQSSVHHNYIHHNQARGEGYGVALYGGTSIIEANIFDYNRHSITGTGYSGEGYEARYNIVKGNGNAIGGHHFDVHQDERGGSFAGNLYKIHHNTFQDGNGKMASIAIRQRPVTGMYIDHNVFETISNATEGGVPIWERDSNQNMFVTNNYWNGTLYSDDEIVSYINQ
jgi:PKD repeat protein